MIANKEPKRPNINWADRVHQYCDDVLTGRLAAGQLVKHAVRRHLNDLETAGERGYVFSEAHAIDVCEFFLDLRFATGTYVNQRFELWPPQAFFCWCLHGWRREKNGFRRFRKALLDEGRGNGKTPLTAGNLLYVAGFDSPPAVGAENFVVATKRDQAKEYCWADARRFAQQSGMVESGAVQLFANSITFPQTTAYIKPLGSDSKTQDSLRIHCLALEEIHAFSERDRELYDKLITAMGKMDQPLMLIATTHGNERSKLWREEYHHAKTVVDPASPINEDTLFAYIAEIDDEDDIHEEANWVKANPLLPHGVVKIEHLRNFSEMAKLSSEKRVSFRRFHCNQYVTSAGKPVTPKMWHAGSGELPDLAGMSCRVGVDLGWKDDLAALAAVFPLDSVQLFGEYKRRYAVKVWCWCPLLDTPRDLTGHPWNDWILRRHLFATRTQSTDTGAMFAKLQELRELYWVRSLVLDGNNAREFGQRCVNDGVDVYEMPQNSKKYHEPTQEFLLALAEGRILHGDNPLLSWAAFNLVLDRDSAGYVMPSKKHSEDKIDPVVATIMALSEVMFNDDTPRIPDGPDAVLL